MENTQLSERSKRTVLMLADLVSIPAILYLSIALRYGEFKDVSSFWWLFPIAAVSCVAAFSRLGLYRAIVRYIGPSSLLSVFHGVSIAAVVVTIAAYLTPSEGFPRSAPVIFWFMSILCVGGMRLFIRGYFYGFSQGYLSREPVAIYGAGSAGAQLAITLLNGTGPLPVAFFDDDRRLRKNTIHGIRVYGPAQLEEMISQHGIKQILLAMPSATATQKRAILDRLTSLPVVVKTVPELGDIISGRAHEWDVREVQLEDLLGRDSIPPDQKLMSIGVTNKSVMVTGGGGSIGSELARILLANKPKKLLLLDNSEFNLFRIDRELSDYKIEHKLDTEMSLVLGCVTDAKLMSHLMGEHKIQTVYHAAAYKHVHMVERNALEGIKNNVIGTRVVAEAALANKVDRFVLISSDKAVNSMNVMGATKKLAEMIVQSLADELHPTTLAIVRFGNVLGSSGSVVPLFREQIDLGGPVTVTHKMATRYFMTIKEAAELVIQAGGMAEDGDMFVLNMGDPVSIDQLARKMIMLSGRADEIEIVYTGLRQGEKLKEELFQPDHIAGTSHPNILRTWEPVVPWGEFSTTLDAIEAGCLRFDHAMVFSLVEEICPGVKAFQTNENKVINNISPIKPITQ